MNLVYIKYIGQNYKEENIYQFLFSENIDNVMHSSWSATPSNGIAEAPKDNIDLAKNITCKMSFDLVCDSMTFSYFDAVEGVVSVGWENIETYSETQIPKDRLFFKYGEDLEDIKEKIIKRNLNFD